MRVVIKSLTSGKTQRRRCFSPFSIMLLFGTFSLLVQTVISDKFDPSAMDRLRNQLFINYDKNLHPMYDGDPTNVTIGLTINYIDIDEMNGKLTLHSWLRISWRDEQRSWNPADYNNITQLHIKPRDVWKPDISLFNSAGDNSNYLGDTQVLLMDSGSFLWVPPTVYTAYCNLNLLLWPYDMQTCSLKIGTWGMTAIDTRDLGKVSSLDYNELVQSTEWDIMGGDVAYYTKFDYNYLEYTLKLQRRSSMYTAIIFTPASCIIILALATFWLPPQMGEKILLNSVIIIMIVAFLMYFAQLLPILAENTPLIVLFYSSSLLLLSLSTIIAVLVLYIATARHKRRLPVTLKNLLNGPLGTILCISHFSLESEPQSILSNCTKELSEHVYESADNDAPDPLSINPMSVEPSLRSIQFDWILLATAVDRIAFLCYCIIFAILAVTFSV